MHSISVPWNHFNKVIGSLRIHHGREVYATKTSKHLLNWRRRIGYFGSYCSKCRWIYIYIYIIHCFYGQVCFFIYFCLRIGRECMPNFRAGETCRVWSWQIGILDVKMWRTSKMTHGVGLTSPKWHEVPSLKLTAKAPENGCLEDDPFRLGWLIFRGYVSFRESKLLCFFGVHVFWKR